MAQNQVERIRRIGWLYQTIKTASGESLGINEEFIIADCMFEWGTARRTVLEYLNALKKSNRVELEEVTGELFTSSYFKVRKNKKKIMTHEEMEANKVLMRNLNNN